MKISIQIQYKSKHLSFGFILFIYSNQLILAMFNSPGVAGAVIQTPL